MIAANGRDDRAELDRLYRSCAKRQYVELDAGFVDRMTIAEEIVIATTFDLGATLSRLELLRGMRPLFEAIRHIATDQAAAAAYSAAPAGCRDRVLDAILDTPETEATAATHMEKVSDRAEAELELEAAAIAHGLAGLARDELQVDPIDLIRSFAPPFLGSVQDLLEAPVPDRALDYERFYIGIWRWRLGLQPDPPDLDSAGTAP